MKRLAMCALIAAALCAPGSAHAQALDPYLAEQAYLTDDPIDPNRVGLATPEGRYALVLLSGCEGIGPGQNVTIWPSMDLPPWLAVGSAGWDLPGAGRPPCLARLEGRMDTTPCFVDEMGQCDVAAELE